MTDPRSEDTPIPSVHLESVEKELQEFLHGEAKKRIAGHTIEAVLGSLHTLQSAVLKHIAEDQKYHLETDRRLDKYERLLSRHEERIDAVEKAREESARGPLTLPPMRDVLDTGSFNVNADTIAKAKVELLAQLAAADERNRAQFQELKDRQVAKQLEEQQAVIVELKEEKKTIVLERQAVTRYLGRTAFEWVGTSIGAIVLALFVWWLAKH